MTATGFDIGGIYEASRARLIDLAPTLDEGQLATVVPTCPDWTVKDIYGHLTGLCLDILEAKVPWPGADDATAAQVAARRDMPVDAICEEWSSYADAIRARFERADGGMRFVAIDAWTHDQDAHNALGIASGRDGDGRDLTISGVWRLKRVLRDEGLAPLRIVTEDHDWTIGEGDPGATLRLPAYELARATLGRRSLEQIRAYDWTGGPEPYLPHLSFFPPTKAAVVE